VGINVVLFIKAISHVFDLFVFINTLYLQAFKRFLIYPSVCRDEIRRGQEVFIRDLPICGLTLFYLSLVGGFSAPLITKVLRATGYLTSGPKRVMRRLADIVTCHPSHMQPLATTYENRRNFIPNQHFGRKYGLIFYHKNVLPCSVSLRLSQTLSFMLITSWNGRRRKKI